LKNMLLSVVAFLLCAGLGYSQDSSGLRIERIGVANVHTLPGPNAHSEVRPSPFLVDDPQLFQGQKLQAQKGRGGGSSGGTVTETDSSLNVNAGFTGLTLSDTPGYVPPDTQVAASTQNLVEMVNGTISVYDRTVSPATPIAVDMCSFFYCDFLTAVISDPIVRYDPGSVRWFASVVTIEYVAQGAFLVPEGQWRLAVSQSSDPSGNWIVYAATMSDGTFPDFPKMAISSDKVVQTGDAFTISSSRFKGTEFAVLNKADLLAGLATPGFQFFAPPQGLFALAAAELLPSSSVTSTIYLAAVPTGKNVSSVRVWQLNGVPNSTGTGVSVTTTNYSTAPFKTPPNAPQLGSSALIDTNGYFLVDAFYQDGHVWVAANSGCVPSGDTITRSCVRLVELAVAGTPSVMQDLTFGEKGEYYYYPAIRADGSGNLIAVFNRSSATEYVGVYASGQLAASSNTFQTPVVIKTGETAYTISPPRWGDYSGASADPSNSMMVWLAGEYAQSISGGNQWATWVTQVHF
jgi:hypothetical protein